MKKTTLLLIGIILSSCIFNSCIKNKKKRSEIDLLQNASSRISEANVKTTNRPNGVTIKYFNSIPVSKNSFLEAGLSLYKNVTTNQFFVVTSVLFKKEVETEMSDNLIIQTTGNKGISLKPIGHEIINMNNKKVASSMFFLTDEDISELKKNSLKSITVTIKDRLTGFTITNNKDLLQKELEILNNLNK